MKITFVSPALDMSGGIKVIAIYANALKGMGHDVSVVSPPHRVITTVEKIKLLVKGRGWQPTWAPDSYLDGSEVDQSVLDRWRPVADDDVPDADVVIATWWETAEWVNALSEKKGAKVYFIQHHEVFPYLPAHRCRATYRLPLHKIVVAPWLQRVMSEQYDDDVVDIVPNSVDREQFFAPIRGKQANPTVGFLYSGVPFKGLDVTLAALGKVREQIPNVHVISFGNQRPSADMPLPEGAEFFHLPPQDQLRHVYARCDVWVTASRSEGFNLPAMEAMACRTPVVSTRTGWPEDSVKTGWNGVIVDIDDVNGLAHGIEWVLSRSESDWGRLSENACATATVGSWEESAKLFEAAIRRACYRAERGEIAGGQGISLGGQNI